MFTRHLIREYGGKDTRNQYNAYKGSLSFIQRLQIERRLEVHSGCVNTICWNDRGTNILSGSDDLHLVVSNPYNGKIIHKIRSGHRQNIFSAKYLANGLDSETISCSGDGKIFYTHLEREDLANAHMFDCHFGTTYEVLVIPNEASTFLSCGEDGTVRFFDLREKSSCSKPSCKEDVMITCRSAITAMAANPLHPWQLGVGCSDSSVRIYDRRMLGTRATGNYSGKSLKGLLSMFTPPSLEKESYRVTSLHYSSDGRDVLVSYSSEQIYIFSSQDCDDFKPLVKEVPEIKSSGVPATESSDEPSPGQSSASDGVALPTNDTETRQPPVKRLRLRGDWSDTGPGARPERQTPGGTTSEAGQEHQEATGSARSRVMNRMSDLLTRWLVTNMRSTQAQRDSQTTEGGGEQGAQELVGADRGATEGSLEGASEGDQPASDNNHEPVQEIHEFSEETQAMLTEMGRDIPRNVSSQSDSLSGQHSGEAEMYSESENVQSEKESTACGHTDDSSFNDSQTVPSKSDIANVEESLTNIDNGTSSKSIPEICRDHDINESKSKGYDEDAYTPQTFNLKAESPDSVGSKSDESQSSVVNKIEVMAVSDELAEDNSSKHCDNETEISDAYNPLYPTTYKSALESEIAGGMESNSVPVSQPEADELGSHGEQDRSESSLANNTSERTEIRAAVESLRAQNLAPVVSLHYSSEGTSAGTIRVGFTQFQSLEDEIAAENPTLGDSQTESDNNSVSVIRQNISDTVNTSSSQQELNVDDSRDIANSSVLQGNSEVNDGSKNQKHTPENDNRHASESYSMETQNTKSEETMLKPFCPEEMEVASGSNLKDLPDDVDSDMEENEQAYCDNEDRTRTKLLPSVSVQVEGAMSNEGKSEQNIVDNKVDINIIAEDSESHTEEIRSEVLETVTSDGNEATGDSRTDSQATGGEENVSGTLPRQRRIGHSGPPTGSFHLNSSDSSSDDEGGAESRREDLMRQTAARKLQAFHRLRQEAREKKEMAESNIGRPTVKHVYKGHRNARTMIKEASFWGDNYVMSGSDCGHVFVWDRHTTEVVMLLEADKHVVNCIQPHPFDPVLATSGIDYDIKIWSPLNEKPSFDEQRAKEVMLHNEIMLEETRDTITVPASFMLRVLASINSIRSGRRAMERNRTSSGENQDEAGRQASDTD